MRTLVTLTLVAVSGLLPAAAATGSDSKPRLVVLDRTPIVVRGLRFEAGERVYVRAIVRGGPRAAKTVVATRGGVFSARFASVRAGRCAFVTVQATGTRGSRARFTQHPPLCGPAP
jgi:hypothetical protein